MRTSSIDASMAETTSGRRGTTMVSHKIDRGEGEKNLQLAGKE
jgi:hypothetical protein